MVPRVGLWSVIVAYPGDTHLLLEMNDEILETMITPINRQYQNSNLATDCLFENH